MVDPSFTAAPDTVRASPLLAFCICGAAAVSLRQVACERNPWAVTPGDDAVHALHIHETDHGPYPSMHLHETALHHMGSPQLHGCRGKRKKQSSSGISRLPPLPGRHNLKYAFRLWSAFGTVSKNHGGATAGTQALWQMRPLRFVQTSYELHEPIFQRSHRDHPPD